MPSLSATPLSCSWGAAILVSSTIIYFLTILPVKLFCAVVLLGWVETHLNLNLSPSHHVVKWLNNATPASFRLALTRSLVLNLVSHFTLYFWVVLVASILLLTSVTADGACIARRQYMLEGQARSEKLWRLLLGVPEA